MKDISSLMGNLKDMKSTFDEMQSEMSKLQAEGISGGGMVKVTVDGKGMITNIIIDPELMKSGEEAVLADLVLTAHNIARVQIDTKTREKTMEMSGKLPDFLSKMGQ